MKATTHYTIKKQTQKKIGQQKWQRIVLLSILGYEAAGCLLGGSLLVAAPNGSYMDMPIDMMHGVFPDFRIPGMILFGLGVLNTLAFSTVLRRTNTDWLMAGIGLSGLFIWFVVEIIILRELHWLHIMWGFPVFLGCVLAIPLFGLRDESPIIRKALLLCGIISSLWYVVINIFVPIMYDGYSTVSLTVSELSAIDAPTRILWVLLVLLYPLLFAAFGWGVWYEPRGNHSLRVVGILILIYSIVNFYWPPMHQREVIAAGNETLTDTLHIAWAVMTVLLMMLLMGFGASALGKEYRIYTMATFAVFIVFGILIGVETPGISGNLPTPHIGVWERINIGAFMQWVAVLAIMLLREKTGPFNSLIHIEEYERNESIDLLVTSSS